MLLSQYTSDMALPLALSKEEQHNLLVKVGMKDSAAREKIIAHNLRLVVHIAKKYCNCGEFQDLFSIGEIGLIKAVDTFQVDKKVLFATYASRCISNEILMYLRKNKYSFGEVSIDEAITSDHEGNEKTIGDTLISEEVSAIDAYVQKESYGEIREILSKLPVREQQIISMHFGFVDDKVYTQKEISICLGLSQSYISRIVVKTLKFIRQQLEENNIDFSINRSNLKTQRKSVTKKRQIKGSLYDFFPDFSVEKVDAVLVMLRLEELDLLKRKFGEQFNCVCLSNPFSKEEYVQYYNVISKIKRYLNKPVSRERKSKELISNETEALSSNLVLSSSVVEKNVMSKEDYIHVLEIFQTKYFTELTKSLPLKDSIVIALKLGYVDSKYFSSSAIASFLGIEIEEVVTIVTSHLTEFKHSLTNQIDQAITDEPFQKMLRADILTKPENLL